MDLISFGQTLSQLLPKIKTRLQLSGLALGLAFALFVNFARPGDNLALITAGSVGVSFVIFGQLFHFLKDFGEHDRPRVFLWSFGVFCVFTLLLLITTVLLLRKPTLSVSKFDPSPELEVASDAPVPTPRVTRQADPAPALQPTQPSEETAAPTRTVVAVGRADRASGEVLTLPNRNRSRNAQYTFRMAGKVSTLKARLMYSVDSRRGLYPDADFHADVSWGSPWLSFDIANPSNENLLFTSLKTEAIEIRLINDVILHVPNIENATPAAAKLQIINEGWGKATHPTLEIRFVRPASGDRYVVVGQKRFTLDSFDEGAVVDLAPSLPPLSSWQHRRDFKPIEYCKVDGYLEALGRLHYLDDEGSARVETFRTGIFTCIEGGGNIFPSAYFNMTLPYEKDEYPIFIAVSDCISPKSADELVVRLRTKRSAHFRLKFTLTATNGYTVERLADVDILVPRFDYQSVYREGKFFKAGKDGCT